MPSEALRAVARAHAARIVSGEVTPSDGARAIWTDVFYHLELGDHFVDGFIFWGYELDTAETDARRWFCEAAVVNLARRLLKDTRGTAPQLAQDGRRVRVTLDDVSAVHWLEPWRAVVPGLEVELRNETSPGHPLFGQKAISVARRFDSDDVLFLLLEHPAPLAVVHLSWTGRPERHSAWPHTTFYESLEDFAEQCMGPDHRERIGGAPEPDA
jgi:hypothetical protein